MLIQIIELQKKLGMKSIEILHNTIKTINNKRWTDRGVEKVFFDRKTGLIDEESFIKSYKTYQQQKSVSKQTQAKKMSKIMKNKARTKSSTQKKK